MSTTLPEYLPIEFSLVPGIPGPPGEANPLTIAAAAQALVSAQSAATQAAAALAASQTAAALAASFRLDVAKRSAVLPSLDLEFEPEVTPAGLTVTRASIGTRINRFGRIETISANLLRHDYEPLTGAYRGVRLEEARTNLLLQSEDLGHAVWTPGVGWTSSATAGIDPKGGTQARYLVANIASPDSLLLRQYPTLPAGSVTASIWLFVPSQAGVTSWALGADAQDVESAFSAASTVFDRWVRASVTLTLAATRSFIDFNLRFNGAAPSGVGKNVYLAFPQVEAGAFMTSYIATTTATVTRAADLITMATAGSWYNQLEGTLFAVSQRQGVEGSAGSVLYPGIVRLDDGTLNNAVSLLWYAGGSNSRTYGAVNVGGVTQAAIGAVYGMDQNAVHAAAIAYKANDFAGLADGGVIEKDTAGTIPTVNRLALGPLGGWLRRVSYWPRRLSDADLQAITAI